jgi:UDP-glucose 4-epimerase
MKIAVTGGAGFVGHHIAQACLDAGHEVIVIDDLRAGVNLTPKGCVLLREKLGAVIRSDMHGVDAVIHAAARADVSSNWVDVDERDNMTHTNVLGTQTLLEAMPESAPIVFLSTCAVYGDTANGREEEACIATSPYAASKLAGEALVQAYAYKRGVAWHVLRLGCVVGSGMHHGHAPDFVRMARETGAIHAKSDGTVRKSFVHALDVAGAAMHLLGDNERSGVYNLARGPWTWRDTHRVMGLMRGVDVPLTFENQIHGWVGDPMAIASGRKLASNGYMMQHSVEEGMREALASLGWPS